MTRFHFEVGVSATLLGLVALGGPVPSRQATKRALKRPRRSRNTNLTRHPTRGTGQGAGLSLSRKTHPNPLEPIVERRPARPLSASQPVGRVNATRTLREDPAMVVRPEDRF
jgi:hypothetical protein